MWHPLSAKIGNHFADKHRSLGRYSSLADSDPGVFVYGNSFLFASFANSSREVYEYNLDLRSGTIVCLFALKLKRVLRFSFVFKINRHSTFCCFAVLSPADPFYDFPS
jgi:hypothetical protein